MPRDCRRSPKYAALVDFAEDANPCRKNTCIREAADSPDGIGT
jgi:hypothetical protein